MSPEQIEAWAAFSVVIGMTFVFIALAFAIAYAAWKDWK